MGRQEMKQAYKKCYKLVENYTDLNEIAKCLK
jgi:hypothetical protein